MCPQIDRPITRASIPALAPTHWQGHRIYSALYLIEQENLTRQRAVEAQVKADEVARRSALLEESSTWHKAEQIKAFVAHVISRPEVANPASLDSWSKWALKVADATDSVPGRVDALNQGEWP